MKTSLPPAIASYFQAANAHNSTGVLAQFTDDGLVTDEGHDYRGQAIKEWCDKVNEQYHPQAEVIAVTEIPEGARVAAQVSGTFPGSPVELQYRFALKGDKIAALRIEA